MAAGVATRIEDYLGLLAALAQIGEDVLIVGGHAVNLWAELYLTQEPELSRFLPFTSRDLDLHRPGRAASSAFRKYGAQVSREANPFGKMFELVEASFSLQLRDGRTLIVEALKFLPGLTSHELKAAIVQVDYQGLRLSVPHPIALLKAKAHNLAHLNQSDRQDAKHFQILILCARAFLREWLARHESGESPRRIFGLLELALKTARHNEVMRAAQALGLHPKRSLPLIELGRSRSPQVARFLSERLPRWEKSVARKLGLPQPPKKLLRSKG
jgi:hypothetical protein